MSYQGHPSTFAPMISLIASICDPTDRDQVAAVMPELEKLIEERLPEEASGEGAYRVDFAWHRLNGAATELRALTARARQARACPLLLKTLDRLTTLCVEATDVAQKHKRGDVGKASTGPAAWARAEIRPTTELPDFLKDI